MVAKIETPLNAKETVEKYGHKREAVESEEDEHKYSEEEENIGRLPN